jgi:hypothetical protein
MAHPDLWNPTSAKTGQIWGTQDWPNPTLSREEPRADKIKHKVLRSAQDDEPCWKS